MADAKPFVARLNARDKALLRKVAEYEDRSMANVLQVALREYAKKRDIRVSARETRQ